MAVNFKRINNMETIIQNRTCSQVSLTDLLAGGTIKDLKDIGFYTLSNKRAKNSSKDSPLYRCELILTDNCNFKCPYCRGLRDDMSGELPFSIAMDTLKLWVADGLRNVRFSGGEPTLYPQLDILVKYCKDNGVEHIAISTNGSAKLEYYEYLFSCGVNDFSISLDSGCCSVGDEMSGGIIGSWDIVTKNIKALSILTYVSVGVVFSDENVFDAVETVKFSDSLGVDDIRVIPAAQYGKALKMLTGLPSLILSKYPILKYRIDRARVGGHVRGVRKSSTTPCRLVLDDIASANGYHFPCIIYMREGGDPIGFIGDGMREDREQWMLRHNPATDKICSKMCLDVCVDFNKTAEKLNSNTVS